MTNRKAHDQHFANLMLASNGEFLGCLPAQTLELGIAEGKPAPGAGEMLAKVFAENLLQSWVSIAAAIEHCETLRNDHVWGELYSQAAEILRRDHRLFIACHAAQIAYCDCLAEEHGDYVKIAALPYRSLELEIYKPDHELLPQIQSHASVIIAKRGERFQVSTSGQTVVLGE